MKYNIQVIRSFLPSFLMFLYINKLHANVQTNFDVTAHVNDVCEVEADDLDFGAYDPFNGGHLDVDGEIRVRCTINTNYEIGCNAGNGNGATVNVRRLTLQAGAGQTLDYTLYRNLARNQVWGVTQGGGGNTIAAVGTGLQVQYPVYGRITSGQNVPVGNYTDTIQVTVFY